MVQVLYVAVTFAYIIRVPSVGGTCARPRPFDFPAGFHGGAFAFRLIMPFRLSSTFLAAKRSEGKREKVAARKDYFRILHSAKEFIDCKKLVVPS